MAWHPNGNILTYALEEGSRNLIYSVDLTSFESVEKEVFRIDKILSMAYAPDGMTMIWSGVKDGQSDLYRYQVIGNNHTALWSDPYDDLDPVFSEDGQSIWFTSNRPNAQLNRPFVLGEPLRANTMMCFNCCWTEDIPQLIHWIEYAGARRAISAGPTCRARRFLGGDSSSGQQERWISWRGQRRRLHRHQPSTIDSLPKSDWPSGWSCHPLPRCSGFPKPKPTVLCIS